jgi:hypothetical protein
MNRQTHFFVVFALMASLFLAAGCAPTVLGTKNRMGTNKLIKPMFGEPSERNVFLSSLKYEVIPEGEYLTVNIETDTGVCTANLKLDSMRKGFVVVPFMENDPSLLYKGTWANDLSSDCLKATTKKGGSPLYAQIMEPDDGMRSVLLCTDQTYISGIPCGIQVVFFAVPAIASE